MSAGSAIEPHTVVTRLTEGHQYLFRVFAENECGASEPVTLREPITAKLPYSKRYVIGWDEMNNK